MSSDELIERIARAIHVQCSLCHAWHTWDSVDDEHRQLWRGYAVAAIDELIAMHVIKSVFPHAEVVDT